MIIDQLPSLVSVQDTDEVAIERGTTTYKTTVEKLSDEIAQTGGVQTALAGKQDTLVSGTNIKTVGGNSLLGSGDISVGVNRNLLDNWYFGAGFPVNQRGQTSYSTVGYCIDRWKLTSGSLSVDPSGILLNGTIEQTLQNSIGLQTVASALLSDGTMITPTYNDSTKKYTITATNKTIVAVKLELGSTQTLAHQENGAWVLNEIPNYAVEFAKCQCYFVKFQPYQRKRADAVLGTAIDFLFPIPCTMASLPSIIGAPAVHLYGATEPEQTGFTFSVPGQGGGYIQIRAVKTNHGLTDATCYGTSSWYLSCEP